MGSVNLLLDSRDVIIFALDISHVKAQKCVILSDFQIKSWEILDMSDKH